METPCVPCKTGYISFLSSPLNRFVFFNANRLEKKELILFCDAVENLIVNLPKALEKALSLTEQEIQADPGVIFFEDLSCFSNWDEQTKKILMFKNSLSVNTYQSNIYIWIKRYFYDSEKQIWSACRGGHRFSPKFDDFEAILEFLKKHVNLLKVAQEQKNVSKSISQQLQQQQEQEQKEQSQETDLTIDSTDSPIDNALKSQNNSCFSNLDEQQQHANNENSVPQSEKKMDISV